MGRYSSVNNLLPPKFYLLEYQSLINKMIDIALLKTQKPLDIFKLVVSGFHSKIKNSSYTDIVYQYLEKFSVEDLQQQGFLFLLELWNHHQKSSRWTTRQEGISFYDFIRKLVPVWIGRYIANQILIWKGDKLIDTSIQTVELVLPEIFKPELSWVVFKNTDKVFGRLSVKQKYYLYLKYGKDYSVEEISKLLNQHPVRISREFSIIEEIIQEGLNSGNSRRT